MATTVAVATMKVAQIAKPGAGFQIVEREIANPRMQPSLCKNWAEQR